MSKYFDVDDLINRLDGEKYRIFLREILHTEPESIVRCKDCKHYAKEIDGLTTPMYICKRFTEWEIDEKDNLELMMKPDDYCSYGERKEE